MKDNNIKMSISCGKPITNKYCNKMNIGNLLIEAAENQKDKGILLVQGNNSDVFLTYEEILEKAMLCLGALQEKGIKKDDFAIISFQNNIDFITCFWACILGGIVAVPISTPSAFKGKNASLEKLINVWHTLEKPVIISDNSIIKGMKNNDFYSECQEMNMLDISILRESKIKGKMNLSETEKPAFIQFSSGSTNTPKGVVLTHKNLLTNIEGIADSAGLTTEDRVLSWMPYYHDMGLIGFHLTLIALGMFQINMNPMKFVKRPTLWFDLISEHKITITSSPNFGYRLLLRKVTDKHLKEWDLSSLRLIFNGAEPISMPLVNEFMEKLSVCNLSKTSMFMVYGMAEACLAVTFPPLNSKPLSHFISRNSLVNKSEVEEVDESAKDALQVADEGYPVAGMQVRVVNDDGEIVPENILGEIQIKGENVTKGYINNPEATAKSFQDGWLKTGDTGFIIDGRLCVTGRIKDIIFVNGQNFFAHDIEFKLEEIEGVETGKVVVGGWHDEKEGREKIAIFSSLRVKEDELKSFYGNMLSKINEAFGIYIDFVVLVKAIPKTTSGKVRRFMLVQSFLDNEFVDSTLTSGELLLNIEEKAEEADESKASPLNISREKIKEIWADVLDRPAQSIGYNQSFLSLGGTSIKAVQVLGILEDELDITLGHDILINCRTINEMNEYLKNFSEGNSVLTNINEKVHGQVEEDDEIAVIEMSCRFPEASSPEEFWDNIVNGKCSISEVPEDRWDVSKYYSKSGDKAKTYCKTGAFIDKPFDFDAKFFNISDEEAAVMDPQQRIILELVFEILERAGYSKKKVSGESISLYIGAGTNTYQEYHLNTLNMSSLKNFDSFNSLSKEVQESILEEWKNTLGVTEFHTNLLVDNILNMIAARTSQEFNFKGPSMVIDTACSSSLVTIHLACEALRKGECELAIAGGINLLLTPTPYIYLSNAGALSTSGISRVFDAKADGLVPGEGAGLVLLKPLKKALKDKDKVLAVIKASAINNDGHSIGVMAPNPDGQREVIESLYVKSGISPKDIQYIEAHGTGTKIGDPSEVRALSNAFKRWNPESNSMAIGSVKANIGHLLNGAGIASFIKVILAINNKTMPPNVNLNELNPSIKFDKTPFYTMLEAKKWEVQEGKMRKAAVNSFGFGGTNCHMVLEEAPSEIIPAVEVQDYSRNKHALNLSANSPNSLQLKINNLVKYLKTNKEINLGDVCYTENVLRTSFDKYRYSVVSETIEDLINKLQASKVEEINGDMQHKVALMFTGQGSQYVGMGRELYNKLPIFKGYVDKCSEAFSPYLNEKITDLIYSDKADESILAQTNITQPVVFTMDYAFGRLLIDLGIKPAYMLGHSVGEWAAACLAEVITLEDAAKIVSARGKLMGSIKSSGCMCAVFTSSEKLENSLEKFKGAVWIAAYNGTHQVISGDEGDVDRFCSNLLKEGIGFKKLKVSQAFHTPLMEPILNEFRKVFNGIKFNSPKIPLISNVTGKIMDEAFDIEYWINHILSSVKFEQSIKYLSDKAVDVLIECGPDRVLSRMASGVQAQSARTILSLSDRKMMSFDVCLEVLSSLFTLGFNVDFEKFESGIHYNKLQLPSYPFERKTYKPDFGNENIKVPDEWFYNWNWKAESHKYAGSEIKGNIVIFSDGSGIEDELDEIFKLNKIYVVKAGSEYTFDEYSKFIIDPIVEKDYAKVFNSIQGPIGAVIHLWNLNDEIQLEFAFDDKAMHEYIYSILYIGKALSKLNIEKTKLLLVTNNGLSVNEENKISSPHQASAITLAQALDVENDFVDSYCIDVDKKEYVSKEEIAKILSDEIKHDLNKEGIVAVRGGVRFIRELVNNVELNQASKIKFNDGETYLITGGASAVGSEIAKAIAKKAKINLILTGREELPDPEKWDNELVNNTKCAKKISLIMRLKVLGANVIYEAVDVTKIDDMKVLIERISEKYGAINGVIHAAGTFDSKTFRLLDKDVKTINKVIEPKLKGSIITDLVTRKEPLKFFAMLSSVSCSEKLWSAGVGDYAAANAFLSAYSYYRSADNGPGKTIALNYSLWAGTGMGSDFGNGALLALKAQGVNPLPAKKASEAFMRALSVESKNVIHIIDKIEGSDVEKSPTIKMPKVNSRKLKNIKEVVYKIIAKQLKVEEDNFDVGKNFLELGLDSLGAIKVMEVLGTNIGMELYPTLIFEYQTPQALAEYIEKTYLEGFGEAAVSKIDDFNTEVVKEEKSKDIAIISASLRIPGANNLNEYWRILENGECVIREIPEDRWPANDHYSEDTNSTYKSYSKCGGFIENPYEFDPLFFGMSPSEAAVTDPQQRIFLEIAWEVMQQAGYGGRYSTNNIGVFVGSEQNGYSEHFTNYRIYMELKDKLLKSQTFNNMNSNEKYEIMSNILNVLKPAKMVPDAVAGNSLNEVAARVSHCLNLSGPSLTVNSACSSSLSALHLACESIRTGQCKMAIVGGVNLNTSPTPFIGLSRVQALSKIGICYPFDDRADGMVLSEGASAILLKPLEDAIADNDNIMAVIKGSAMNNDGHSQGITAPRPQGQADAVMRAYLDAKINPETISYVETHGTGTPLGDPIEIEGMTKAFRAFTQEKGFCAIGSVKSSIGHMLSASGITSLIKVVLALENKKIPHTINYDKLTTNRNIDFENSPFFVAAERTMEWEKSGVTPLRAGVNGFGFGGTNVHVILEEAPEKKRIEKVEEDFPYLLQLTGRNQSVIKNIALELKEYINWHENLNIASICFTMNNSQKELSTKNSAVVESREHLLEILADLISDKDSECIYKGRSNPNRQTEAYLILDGRIKNVEKLKEDLSLRFDIFNIAYKECLTLASKSISNEKTSDFESFAVHYAIGVLLSNFEMKLYGIIAEGEGTGVLAASVLNGKINLRHALEQILGTIEAREDEILEDDKNVAYLNCPILTSSGVLEDALNISQNDDKNIRNLNGFVNKNQVIIYPGNLDEVKNKEFYNDKNFNWIGMDISRDSVKSIISTFAKLYTLGVRFNPSKLFKGNVKKVMLPTYPFENETYKVSFEEELTYKESDHISMQRSGLRRMEMKHILSESEKRSISNQLSIDIGK
ncbi:type I polyketide synthase [Clostridium beijerinckii]|uniref:type I polyketide synthase n=1 Tax=Clostridium beijerinckii TaxID=1520 RepID=UPI00098BF253|nr:type I polyketide synthase [Clostridium beijerinckii]NOW04512.1 acyl transferase domain-containing protein/acyl-CoA synthetase (AMP-forming)/AMP-acid ligase II/acyl carrier protein/NAD(P)-dependent dehydrogenase (short-subunit alcohol dehydrogenase family) [Clostridium beijerinckii]NRT35453.1 acyl transferase domain-containing protein/acyl-CoA synthetase (AMP-forming)/AMP-acid ligase II/acyl carrier protein/NAD(P)-dependent dehydrogenase (short-subunit alcohol dehydrogenase family) [Clostridiu